MTPQNLGAVYRQMYRDEFRAEVAAGRLRPMVIPHAVFGGVIVPVLYMSIPHARRPWLFKARWLVMAFIFCFNLKMISETSSTNMPLSYACGLWGFWGIMSNFALLVWSRPQFDAERVMKRRRKTLRENGALRTTNTASSTIASGADSVGNGVLLQPRRETPAKDVEYEKLAPGAEADHEYYWQSYPENGSFLDRLGWTLDLYTNFRGAGWNWAVRSIPNPPQAEKPLSGELVKMDAIPLETRSGYRTYKTKGEFLKVKLTAAAYAFVMLDFLKTVFRTDGYFVIGPAGALPHAALRAVPSWFLGLCRNLGILFAVHAALVGVFSIHDMAQYFLVSRVFPMRGELWQYSSVFGSFTQVLDRGLAGFWGAWWHQTFRFGFSGPGNWLTRNGYVEPKTRNALLVTMFLAFFQSGLLHGCGSWTSIPQTRVWLPSVFFLLSGVGTVLQQVFCFAFSQRIATLPRFLRRLGNLTFVMLWLHFTVWGMADDLAESGIWLSEPVPISLWAAFGFGQPGESWWKPDGDSYPRWHTGKHWWDSGVGG